MINIIQLERMRIAIQAQIKILKALTNISLMIKQKLNKTENVLLESNLVEAGEQLEKISDCWQNITKDV